MSHAPIIGIDCRFAAEHAGLGRYTRELVIHLVRCVPMASFVLFVRSPEEQWLEPIRKNVRVLVADIGHYTFAEQYRLPLLLRRSGITLLFSPHFNVPFFCPVPFVTTVHDLILHRFPNRASLLRRMAYRLVLSRALRRARAIIAVSRFTAHELRSVYGNAIARKTSVIYEGVDPRFAPASDKAVTALRQRYDLPSHFLLYVGNAKQHKNVQMLLDAYAQLQDGRELILLCGGKEVESLHLPAGARLLTGIDDADLPALYSAADAFVTASLYEGFGLPIAEAQACGCPVIATKCAAIPEVAKPPAQLVEPAVDALAHAMRSVPAQRPSPARHFDWTSAAKETSTLLQSVQL